MSLALAYLRQVITPLDFAISLPAKQTNKRPLPTSCYDKKQQQQQQQQRGYHLLTNSLLLTLLFATCLQVLGIHQADPGLGTHSGICMRTIVKCLY